MCTPLFYETAIWSMVKLHIDITIIIIIIASMLIVL